MRPVSLVLGLALIAAPAHAAEARPGDVILDMRLRYETVDQDGFAKDAQALTLRTRLGYETPAWRGFKALAEVENVTALGDAYNSTTNGKLRYPIVADPEVTELNRAQVSWTGKQADVVVGAREDGRDDDVGDLRGLHPGALLEGEPLGRHFDVGLQRLELRLAQERFGIFLRVVEVEELPRQLLVVTAHRASVCAVELPQNMEEREVPEGGLDCLSAPSHWSRSLPRTRKANRLS